MSACVQECVCVCVCVCLCVCVSVRSKWVSCIQKFLWLMYHSGEMEVNTPTHIQYAETHTHTHTGKGVRPPQVSRHRDQWMKTLCCSWSLIKDPLQWLYVILSSSSLSALTVQHCATELKRIYTSNTVRTHLFCTLCAKKQLSFSPWLQGENIQKSLKLLLVWVRHSSAKGKQAVPLESLFKESDSQWAPPLSAGANGEAAMSRTKTSQARPFLHTRQKNAQAAACYCHRRRSGCLGKRQKWQELR